MAGIVFILFWLLAYLWNKQQPEKSEGDTAPNEYGGVLLALFVAIVLTGFATTVHWTLAIVFHLISISLIFPIIPIRIAILFKMTKLAYFLGGFSLIRFNRNYYSAKLFYGFLAAVKHKDKSKRKDSLEWLHSKFLNSSKKLYSGDIIMHSIIEAHLRGPHKLAKRLKILKGIPLSSVPRQISILAYKFALADELSKNNINSVIAISNQWNTPTRNGLAKYMISACDVIVNPFAKKGWRLKTHAIIARPPNELQQWLDRLELQQKNIVAISELNHTQQIHELIRIGVNKNSSNSTRSNELITLLGNPSSKNQWSARAQELGVWQVEELWQKIDSRLHSFESSDNQSGLIADEERYQELENHHKALKYLERSIESRIEPNISGNTSLHLIDWLKVLEIMSELEVDNSAELTAFSNIHNTLWNWIAGLWNDKKEHRLAVHIATWCIPRAKKCGYTDFLETLHFVTGNVYNIQK